MYTFVFSVPRMLPAHLPPIPFSSSNNISNPYPYITIDHNNEYKICIYIIYIGQYNNLIFILTQSIPHSPSPIRSSTMIGIKVPFIHRLPHTKNRTRKISSQKIATFGITTLPRLQGPTCTRIITLQEFHYKYHIKVKTIKTFLPQANTIHNIIQIHNNVLRHWQYYVEYLSIRIECKNILHNFVSPT